MVVGATSTEGVALLHKSISQGLGVLLDLNGVLLEFWSHDLLELSCNSGDLMIVRTTLQTLTTERKEHT